MPAWRIVSTPPLPGRENMDLDIRAADAVAAATCPAILRFFRWSERTVSYGRLQRAENVAPFISPGWNLVQRPTGGGIVFHNRDLCFSLCWQGLGPLPRKPTEQYEWIHRVAQEALAPLITLRLADCGEERSEESFERRQCFTHPVGFDLLNGDQKIVGGALARRRGVTLYQGSIQGVSPEEAEPLLAAAFESRLSADSPSFSVPSLS